MHTTDFKWSTKWASVSCARQMRWFACMQLKGKRNINLGEYGYGKRVARPIVHLFSTWTLCCESRVWLNAHLCSRTWTIDSIECPFACPTPPRDLADLGATENMCVRGFHIKFSEPSRSHVPQIEQYLFSGKLLIMPLVRMSEGIFCSMGAFTRSYPINTRMATAERKIDHGTNSVCVE